MTPCEAESRIVADSRKNQHYTDIGTFSDDLKIVER
jgi:hypothetical protein